MAITEGSVTSENPIKEAIYFPEPLGSFCEVAVFPPIEKPSIYAFFPPPSSTTCLNISFIVSLVSLLTASCVVEYENSLYVVLSAAHVLMAKCGVTRLPPFTIAAAALSICIGVI